MLYLPDTNLVSHLLNDEPLILKRFRAAQRKHDRFILSPVVHYEVRRGLIRRPSRSTEESYARLMARMRYREFTRSTWLKAAEFWAHSRNIGEPIPDADILVAAQAVDVNATLITANERHFRLFEPLGLRIENWTQP